MSKQIPPTSWSLSICRKACSIHYRRCRTRILKKPVHYEHSYEHSVVITSTLQGHPDTETFYGVDTEDNTVNFLLNTSSALWTVILPIIDSLQLVVCKEVRGWRMFDYIGGPEWDYGMTLLHVYRIDARVKKLVMELKHAQDKSI